MSGGEAAHGRASGVARIGVRLPGVERRQAEELVRDAGRPCPYAKMAREGIHSIVSVID